jgi:hypothetical protein
MLMKTVIAGCCVLALYLASFAVFRWEHACRVNTGDAMVQYRTQMVVDGAAASAMRYLFSPALALDVHLTGRDTLFISRELWSTQSLLHGDLDHC